MRYIKALFQVALLLGTVSACTVSRRPVTWVLLPDTQGYAEKHPEILHSQTSWIAAHAGEIDFVLQQGDLTDDNNEEQWAVVQAAFSRLDGKVPYVLAIGNHDMGSAPGKFADVRNTSLFNKTFPVEKMDQLPGFRGVFEEGRMENAWYVFRTGKIEWLVLTLEFGPRESVLRWANEIAAQNRDKTIILNTHSYMYSDSTRQGGQDWWRPQSYGIGKDSLDDLVHDGEQIWSKLVCKHPHIRFVFSGHVLNSGVGTLISVNGAGFPVYQFLANYQGGVKGSVNEGNGYLRIVRYDLRKKRLTTETWSPWLNAAHSGEEHHFTINHVILNQN